MQSPHDVLGVSKDATEQEIKTAFRRLAKRYHPDADPKNTAILSKFQEIQAAYDTLTKTRKQKTAAKKRPQRRKPQATAQRKPQKPADKPAKPSPAKKENTEPSKTEDIFTDFLSGFRTKKAQGDPGPDISAELLVTLEEVARGEKKRLTLDDGRTIDVDIPVGIKSGQSIRLRGAGERGKNGGPAGDVLITVHVEPHPYFTRHNLDIWLELPISLPEALFGTRLKVPTLTGPVMLNVARGANTGSVLRLKNKGIIAKHNGGPRSQGDQYVELKVVLPEDADREFVKIIKKWAKSHDYDVRRGLTHFD